MVPLTGGLLAGRRQSEGPWLLLNPLSGELVVLLALRCGLIRDGPVDVVGTTSEVRLLIGRGQGKHRSAAPGGHDGTRVVPRDDVVLGRPIRANGADLDLGLRNPLGYQPGDV